MLPDSRRSRDSNPRPFQVRIAFQASPVPDRFNLQSIPTLSITNVPLESSLYRPEPTKPRKLYRSRLFGHKSQSPGRETSTTREGFTSRTRNTGRLVLCARRLVWAYWRDLSDR